MYTQESRRKTADRLHKLRTDISLTPAELAAELKKKYGEKIKVSEDSIKTWETRNPESDRFNKGFGMRIDTLCMIADFFDVTVNYLLGDAQYMEQGLLGLSDKAIEAITSVPQNMVYTPTDGLIAEHRRRENNGQLVKERYLTQDFFNWIDNIPRLYAKVINDILENSPSILSTISTILYVDPDLSRRDQVDHFSVDGITFTPMKPGGMNTINAYLDDLCDDLLILRKRLHERKE